MTITKTTIAIAVICKCGGGVAATMIYGGVSIDEEFTDTMADVINRGGKIEVVNTEEKSVQLNGCQCDTSNKA